MDDIDLIGEIYDAIGDAGRWQRLVDRLAAPAPLSREIAGHLETARRVHEEQVSLSRAIDATASVYDQLALGVLIVRRDGALLRANATARRFLDTGEGLALENGYVRATDADTNVRFLDALARATSPHADQSAQQDLSTTVGPHGRPPTAVIIPPLAGSFPRFFENDLCVPLLIIGLDRPDLPRAEVLQDLFGFTAREAEFATLLMRGLSLKDAAARLGVSMTTARTFLTHITAKTDSHSQAELLLRLSAIPRIQGGP